MCLNFRAFHRTKKLITIDTNWLSLVKKNTGILIVNGRVGNDANMRKCTCKNVSVIDYALASPSFFPDICHFANDSSKENGSLKNSSSKAYKRSINKAMNKFNKDLHQKLRSLQRKNPKEYWQIINHADGSILALSKLNCEIFAKHFKDLNTNKTSDEPFDIDSIPITEDSLNILFYQKMNYYRLLGKMAKYAASM